MSLERSAIMEGWVETKAEEGLVVGKCTINISPQASNDVSNGPATRINRPVSTDSIIKPNPRKVTHRAIAIEVAMSFDKSRGQRGVFEPSINDVVTAFEISLKLTE
jgi:hypothetical protein